jgi:hypothetical protein
MSISAFAGGASDALQEILKQKFLEIVQRQRQEVAMRGLDQEAQRDAANRELGFGRLGIDKEQLGLQGRKVSLDESQFGENKRRYEAEAPERAADVAYKGALTGEIIRKPTAEQQDREFTTSRDKTLHGYRLNAIGAEGAEQRRSAAARMAGDVQPDVKQQQEANEVQQTLDLISRLREDKARPIATGPLEGRGLGRLKDNSGYERVKALHDQLVGRLQLAQAGKLKGQGQVSDREREMLMKAATALTRNLADQDYVNELANVETILRGKLGSGGAAPAQNNDPLGLFKK